jgi:hypothetical protein
MFEKERNKAVMKPPSLKKNVKMLSMSLCADIPEFCHPG